MRKSLLILSISFLTGATSFSAPSLAMDEDADPKAGITTAAPKSAPAQALPAPVAKVPVDFSWQPTLFGVAPKPEHIFFAQIVALGDAHWGLGKISRALAEGVDGETLPAEAQAIQADVDAINAYRANLRLERRQMITAHIHNNDPLFQVYLIDQIDHLHPLFPHGSKINAAIKTRAMAGMSLTDAKAAVCQELMSQNAEVFASPLAQLCFLKKEAIELIDEDFFLQNGDRRNAIRARLTEIQGEREVLINFANNHEMSSSKLCARLLQQST